MMTMMVVMVVMMMVMINKSYVSNIVKFVRADSGLESHVSQGGLSRCRSRIQVSDKCPSRIRSRIACVPGMSV